MKKINILGTVYAIIEKPYDTYPNFEKEGIAGECDYISHGIVVCDIETHPLYLGQSKEYCDRYFKKVLRHEIIHAFLFESGLAENLQHTNEFGHDETMVDWFAIQYPKIKAVYEELGIEV